MRLLVDAQLPTLLGEILSQLGLEATHVDELPEGDETPDTKIADYADRQGLIVVTKDFDFYHSQLYTFAKKEKIPLNLGK